MQAFYEDQPAHARSQNPHAYTTKLQPRSAGKLYRDSYTFDISNSGPAGRCGSRGELVRRPAESGSVYGMSIFVDEYARCGSNLAGCKLVDNKAAKCTQQFEA